MGIVVEWVVTSRGVPSPARPDRVCLVCLRLTPLDLDRPAVEWQEVRSVDRGSACPQGGRDSIAIRTVCLALGLSGRFLRQAQSSSVGHP